MNKFVVALFAMFVSTATTVAAPAGPSTDDLNPVQIVSGSGKIDVSVNCVC